MADDYSERPAIPVASQLAELPADGGPDWNRLVFESSPYLLQHAANPVDWYPWCNAAFEKARTEDKPIFLSIGYATCHWCHVMEHESFEQPRVAEWINRHCVAIKVDKEERPDIDDVYMSACLAMNGRGGWPLTVFLNHDQQPFFAGTYFPPFSQGDQIGLTELLSRVHELWQSRREDLLKEAENITEHIRQMRTVSPGTALNQKEIEQAYLQLEAGFDEKHGGFSSPPKFPSPHQFLLVLRHWRFRALPKALAMVEQTLTAMRHGGVFDQIGFGFHRYSTDAEWLLPHFEKMLYDQALLAYAYLETFAATGKQLYADTVREIFTYVLRDLTAAEGGFFSAEDADSEGEEGKFYVWQPEGVRAVLGGPEAEWFNELFDITVEGNFREEATGQANGHSIPRLKQGLAARARALEIPIDPLQQRVATARETLFEARKNRIAPFKDDKILTDWNGLMIAALALGGRLLNEPTYLKAAKRAAQFIWNQLRDEQGRLLKRYRQGKAGLPAHIDDFAFLCWGALELFQADFDPVYLEMALTLEKQLEDHFWGENEGAYFSTADDGEPLLARGIKIQDGAMPSGNSVMAGNLLRLARLTGRPELEEKAKRIFEAFSLQVKRYPSMSPMLLTALDLQLRGGREVVIVGDPTGADTLSMLAVLRQSYDPNTVVMVRASKDERMDRLVPFTKYFQAEEQRATAYVCQNQTCHSPTTSIEELQAILAGTPA